MFESPSYNTGLDTPPDLDFRRRFVYDPWTDTTEEVPRQTTGPLMTPLMMVRERIPKMLSSVAKTTESGTPVGEYENLLPPPDVAAVMIAQHQHQQPNATAKGDAFPYKLRAVGRVNALAIFQRAGQPGELVATTVQIVP